MKKSFTLFFAVFCTNFVCFAQWQSFDPQFPDTVGMSFVDAVSKNVAWGIGIRYGADECLYAPFVADKCFYTRTDDGGTTWKTGEIPLGTVPFLANITAIDANTAWMCGLDGGGGGSKILKTTDGGTTWTHQTTAAFDPAASWVDFVHFRSPAAGVAMGDPRDGYFEIYTTTNGGDLWFRVPEANIDPPLSGEFGYNGAFDFVGNHYWFATNQGRVFRSTNGGNTWTAHQTTLSDGFFISFSDENHGLLAQTTNIDCSTNPPGFQVVISRTSDGGTTWEDATPVPNNFAISGLEYIKGTSTVVMTGREANLSGSFFTLVSQDHGTTWTQIGTGQNIGWMDFVDGGTGWGGELQMLDNNTEMFRYNGDPLSGVFSKNALDVQVNVFPNPSTDMVRMSVDAGQVGDFLLLLNDAQGRLVRKEAVNGVASFQRHFDLRGLATGMYTLTISSEKGSSTAKFLKK